MFVKKNISKNFAVNKKSHTFATANQEQHELQTKTALGYGVMVTLQILVLSFLVRVRVSQHNI